MVHSSALTLTEAVWRQMVGYAYDGLPEEACGLLRADRDADGRGLEIVGVMHSHTHTEAYPSPTDVAQAPDPSWHYVIVSLKRAEAVLRSYRIVEGAISEEEVGLDGQ